MTAVEGRINLTDHLPLVWWVVNRMRRSGEPRAELAAVASIGLVNAARLHKGDRGKFSTYAVVTMERNIQEWRQKEWRFRYRHGRHLVLFSELGDDFVTGKNRAFCRDDPPASEEYLWLHEAMRKMKKRQQMVLRLRFGFGGESLHTLRETGKRLGISVERTRQIEQRCISDLRYKLKLAGHNNPLE